MGKMKNSKGSLVCDHPYFAETISRDKFHCCESDLESAGFCLYVSFGTILLSRRSRSSLPQMNKKFESDMKI